ncbi:hypothetical protein Tco_0066895 [Tanacetum coccineum]|uniref:Uncharacterized protein n=1 Tax=Tanacetum coccineum TaxID=301880 RepID=A0ABQ5ICD2_9ASTR
MQRRPALAIGTPSLSFECIPIVLSRCKRARFRHRARIGMKDEAKNVPHLRGQKLSRQAKINLDYRPVSPEPASGSLLAKRMLVSLSHDQTNGVKDQKEERGK